jgi:hypothetical protein
MTPLLGSRNTGVLWLVLVSPPNRPWTENIEGTIPVGFDARRKEEPLGLVVKENNDVPGIREANEDRGRL